MRRHTHRHAIDDQAGAAELSTLAASPSCHEEGPELRMAKLLGRAKQVMQSVACAPEHMPMLHESSSQGERVDTEEDAGACMLRGLQHNVINRHYSGWHAG